MRTGINGKKLRIRTWLRISLNGEPTIYPKISDLIEEFKKRDIVPFLVTNGQHPEVLEEMEEPGQLYISLTAPDKETYSKTSRPIVPDAWKNLNRSLELMQSFDCVKVLRLTLVNNWNLKDPSGYAELIEKAQPDFVEPKGYMYVGHSRERLEMEDMPSHEEVKEFARELEDETSYTISDESEPSRVVLLSS